MQTQLGEMHHHYILLQFSMAGRVSWQEGDSGSTKSQIGMPEDVTSPPPCSL